MRNPFDLYGPGKARVLLPAVLLFLLSLFTRAETSTATSGNVVVDTRDFPEIVVLAQPTNANVTTGSTQTLGSAAGTSVSRSFTIRNVGTADLSGVTASLSSPDGSFILTTLPAAVVSNSGSSTTFTVRFVPAGSDETAATIQIASNDPDESPFVIGLTGKVLSFSQDSDSDGLNDAAESQMATLGFDWQLNQSALVATFFASANGAGLYTPSQVQALKIGTPLLTRDPQTGRFKLTIGVKKSTNVQTPFSPFPMNTPQATTVVNSQGELEFEFSPTDDAAFFRLQAQ